MIGFGVARGTACCLYSGKDILDYSGHLLNLASRLNDLARPSGIVIDGNYLLSVIPDSTRKLFKEQQVYVRSIAEQIPMKILYLDNYVQISDASLAPLIGETWKTVVKTFTSAQFAKLGSGWIETLPSPVKSTDKLKVTITVPRKGLKGVFSYHDFKDYTYVDKGSTPIVRFDIQKARSQVLAKNPARNAKVSFRIEYVPKTLPRT